MTRAGDSSRCPLSFREVADADFARLAPHIPTEAMAGKTILLTGSTGFFGSWLLSLVDWQWRTQGTGARLLAVSRDPSAFLAKQPRFDGASWLTWVPGDVRDFPFPTEPIDYVLHAATDTSAAAGRDPRRLLETIVDGTRRVLNCAAQRQAGRILLVSSGAVYGPQPADVTHVDEGARTAPSPLDLGSAYAEGKRMMELMGAIHAHETGAAVTTARCFAFVGAGLPLDAHFAIGNFIRDALWGDRIAVKGGGHAVRSYLYAADLAVWLFRLLLSGETGTAYNVGSDASVTIAELARAVAATLAPDLPVSIEGQDNPNAGRNRYVPSVARAKDLGLDVWTPLEEAIAFTASTATRGVDRP